MKALIIEDDVLLSQVICENIEGLFICDTTFDGEEGLYQAKLGIYDVIILDIMLPVIDGYSVLKELRREGNQTPVLILTAKDSIDNKVKGFQNGADDYLVKPFHREELIVRLQALVRRANNLTVENLLHFKDLSMNLSNRTASIADMPLNLYGKQFDMLEYLIHNKNTIVTKEQIFDRIWGFESETTTNVVEVYASTIRKELKKHAYDHFIKTVRGVGYLLSEE